MSNVTKTMPSFEDLYKKHQKTIESPALKAIRQWRRRNCAIATSEETIREAVVQTDYQGFFDRTLGIVRDKKKLIGK